MARRRRYWNTPSLPSSGSPSLTMKRRSLKVGEPPDSDRDWLAPASGKFQREKPYLAASADVH